MAKSKKSVGTWCGTYGKATWELVNSDCCPIMRGLSRGMVDLMIADPPYNIGWAYDAYEDKKPLQEYLAWQREWLSAAVPLLSPHGGIWIVMHHSLGSRLDVMCQDEFGLHAKGPVQWIYTFGQSSKRALTPAHTPLYYYTKHKDKYTFNADDPINRVPSARALIYNDSRANPKGRLPDDVWILRPREYQDCFSTDAQFGVWLESRVCGTFKERIPGSSNQMPLAIIERMINLTSKPGDKIFDPFTGWGTTGEAALKLGRHFMGTELSPVSCEKSVDRFKRMPSVNIANLKAKKKKS